MISIASAALLALTLAAGQQQSDTVVTVAAGTRLNLATTGGSIQVGTWDRNEVRVQATHGSRDHIVVETRGQVVHVRSERTSPGLAGIVDYRITVPAAMALDLSGFTTNIQVSGSRGPVNASTVQGSIAIRGGAGPVNASSVQGSVAVDGARGPVRVNSVAGGVRLRDVEGSIEAQSVSGSIVMAGIRSTNLTASTVSGSIHFDGDIVPAGHYSFSTHAGPITLGLPENLNATLTLAQMAGSFTSSLGSLASVQPVRGRRESVVVGSGTAMIEAESFAGRIHISRRGEIPIP